MTHLVEWRTTLSRMGALGGAVVTLLLTACAPRQVSLAEGPREYVAQDYLRILQHWTRSTQLLSVEQLDNVLTVTATYESWDFRWAYVIRYADDYRLTVDQRRSLLERSLAETHDEHLFYVALAAQKYKWGDLDLESPAWVLRLIDDTGSETVPTDIVEVKRPGPIEQTYFPYTNPWRRSYRITFPVRKPDGTTSISPKARKFGLRFAGAQGNDELAWELLKPSKEATPSP